MKFDYLKSSAFWGLFLLCWFIAALVIGFFLRIFDLRDVHGWRAIGAAIGLWGSAGAISFSIARSRVQQTESRGDRTLPIDPRN